MPRQPRNSSRRLALVLPRAAARTEGGNVSSCSLSSMECEPDHRQRVITPRGTGQVAASDVIAEIHANAEMLRQPEVCASAEAEHAVVNGVGGHQVKAGWMDDRVREESSSAAGTHEGGNPRIERQHEADSGHQHRGSRLDGARDASGLMGPANEYQRNVQPEARS